VDSIVRSREGITELDVTSFRPTLIYNVNQHTAVGGGYAYVTNYPVIGPHITEHRFFGVAQWTGASHAGTTFLRLRVEDRVIEGNSGPLCRMRPFARFTHPVHSGSKLALVGSDEFMFHVNTTSRNPRGMDQNRAFAGIGTTWSTRMRTEIGYLNQYQPGHNGAVNKMNHIVSTTMTFTF
jgi:hypothetical protein